MLLLLWLGGSAYVDVHRQDFGSLARSRTSARGRHEHYHHVLQWQRVTWMRTWICACWHLLVLS